MMADRDKPDLEFFKKQPERIALPQVKKIIAITSGKGGVGKSTVAVNLAASLAAGGVGTGFVDADIYGPSLPMMIGLQEKPQMIEGKLKPLEKYGLYCMSLGFLMDYEQPLIWRGPMVQTAVKQLFKDVLWPALDVLIVDMPPGTGDAHLTLAQSIPLHGVIIVSTPQDLALIDARKSLKMFQKLNVPILGLMENMSHFECPSCHHTTDIFGHGGGRREAEKHGIPFLGEIPLVLEIRESGDAGTPVVLGSERMRKYYESIVEAIK
jgi:ATP-binding protein involved in chromosome partitioning